MSTARRYPTSHRLPLRAEAVLGVLLACVIGALLAIAAVSWMLCSQSTDQALCMLAAPLLPVRGRVRHAWRQLRRWWLCRQVIETQRQISQYKRLMWDDALRLEQLRNRLAEQQREQLRLATDR